MNGLSAGIVGLWLFPVTLCILAPLAMLAVRTLVQMVNRIAEILRKSAQSKDYQVLKPSQSLAAKEVSA